MDFDCIIDRKRTNCVKWDYLPEYYGNEEVLPLWVADMDFACPKEVTDALVKRATHPIYGYTRHPEGYYQSIINWMRTRHDWDITRESILNFPGVISSLVTALLCFTEPGDKVLVQPPVYPPFFSLVKNNGRKLITNPLVQRNHRYEMDFADLESKLKSGVKMMILCSPHNPVGRVWTKEELLHVGELCLQYEVLLVVDEVWADIVYPGFKHYPIASLNSEIANSTITCMAPSKTFNIAGLATSFAIVPNQSLRNQLLKGTSRLGIDNSNLFGIVALEAAYTHGEEWLNQVLRYIASNYNFLAKFFQEKIPDVLVYQPEATFLVWLNFQKMGLTCEELKNLMCTGAKVGLNDGASFGPEGNGYQRINIACPRETLKTALERIATAINGL